MCRWVQESVILDVLPLNEDILGLSNRWDRAALTDAETHQIAADLSVRIVSAPYFIATKLDAFRGRGRGQGDLIAEHGNKGICAPVPRRSRLGNF